MAERSLNASSAIGKLLSTASLATIAGISLAGISNAADTTYERLANPEPQNWLMHHRDYSGQRFSSLRAINRENVKDLRLKFAIALGGKTTRIWPLSSSASGRSARGNARS